ncbi:MAG: AsmA-like C-terminal region-containing protein, partial [Chloroflexota bacterium]
GIQGVSLCSGTIDTDVKVITKHRLRDVIDMNTFIDMQPEGTLVFDGFALGLEKQNIIFRNVNGELSVSDIYRTPGLEFDYAGQKINYKGDVRNLFEWLAGRPVTLYAAGDISFNRFLPDAYSSHGDAAASKGVNFPTDMLLDINFIIDSLRYKKFASSAIKGSLTYKPRLLTFKSLNFKSVDGSISGNGFIVQNSNKAFISRGDFMVNGIDINKAFATFNNFGQSFVVRENLSGKLSGSISVLLPLNPEFRPKQKELTAEGKYIITDGALINFEPVKKLSSFIELSELENIHFDKLENDFFIRNNALVIPQMDVKSSAADLTVNGRHSFDNNYEYHVKILLSQILSKKRRAAKKPVTEFGAVKDDGLGRTSLLLKVVNRGDDVKVSYDIKAVSQEVNNNLINEKKQLKNMLNEEYGWYDDEVKQPEKSAPAKQSGRFNITWDETDTVAPAVKEEEAKGFRNLFRKK